IDLSRSLQLVLFERPCAWQDEMLNSLNRAGRKWKVSFESASLEAIVTAVQCGIGITALPDEIIRTRGLMRIQNPQLQPPPRIQFGLFQADMTSSEAGTALELALDSTLKSGTGAWVI